MKKGILIFAMACLSWAMGIAQEVVGAIDSVLMDTMVVIDTMTVQLITDDMSYAVVHQDSLVERLMRDKRLGYMRGEQLVDGFRVQIYASNVQQRAKQEATELQQRIESQLDMPVYILSEPPFWKVRVGNFHTREEANVYKASLLNLFPELISSTYIVPDKIIVIR